ncbi:MAG: hypothetical protein ACKO2R_09825, partial [Actinomycetota bacterium]
MDYRLEIVTGSFTTRIGERVIITIATPNDDDITTLLTDPAATATADVSAPLVTRESVTAIVDGGAFESESQTSLVGPLFRVTTLNDAEVFQLNLPTAAAARPDALRLPLEGLRALRVTVTAPSGRIAQLTTFLNVISNRTYAPLPVYFVVDIDGAPSMQPDGTVRLGDAERERLLDLRDLIYRKPPAVQVGIRIRPELIDALTRSSSPDDPQLLADLVGKLPENDVLVGTFRPTSVAAYATAELKAAFEAQLLRGETVLDAVNGPTLSTRTT